MSLKIFLTLIIASCLSLITVSCADDGDGSTRISKGGGGGGPQKPDEQAEQRALKDRVLLKVDKISKLKTADKKTVVVGTQLSINTKKSLTWNLTLPLEIGGELKNPIDCDPAYCDLGDEDLNLRVWEAKRKAKDRSKDDLGYLGFTFQLKRQDKESQEIKKSLLVILLDLNKGGSKAFVKTEVIYPTDKFSLDEWIEKHTKQP